jgi:hypothetical protein
MLLFQIFIYNIVAKFLPAQVFAQNAADETFGGVEINQ